MKSTLDGIGLRQAGGSAGAAFAKRLMLQRSTRLDKRLAGFALVASSPLEFPRFFGALDVKWP